MQSHIPLRHLLGFGVAAAFCGAAMNPPPSRAADTWLMPSTYRAGLADTVGVTCWNGEGFRGRAVAWHRPRVNGFRLVGHREVDIAGVCADGDSVWARFLPLDEEGVLLFAETNWRTAERDRGDLLKEARQLDSLKPPENLLAAGTVRTRERICAKAWLPGATGRRYARTLGGALELTPLTDPAMEGPIRFRLECAGAPLAEARVCVLRQPLRGTGGTNSPAQRDSAAVLLEARTDREGVASLNLRGRGEYLVSAGTLRARADSTFTGLEILRATFTFARPGTPAPSEPR